MNKKALIDSLNALTVGEFSKIRSRLVEVLEETRAQGLDEIGGILAEALELLEACDLKGFRRKVQHAVSRLGHLR